MMGTSPHGTERHAPDPRQERPGAFQHEQFKGQVYRLDEPVIDTASIVEALAEPVRDVILGVDKTSGIKLTEKQSGTYLIKLQAGNNSVSVETQRLVLAAGSGNADLLNQLKRESPLKLFKYRSRNYNFLNF